MIFTSDDDKLLSMMQADFEKVASLKEQHLKQILHPREEAHKHSEKNGSQQQTGSSSGGNANGNLGGYSSLYDDGQEGGQAKENAYKEEYLRQLKLVDPMTQDVQQKMALKLQQMVKKAEQNSLPPAYMFPEHPNGKIKTPVEAYCETFGFKPSHSGMLQTTLGVDHLLNDEDKIRLRNANAQMRNYLDEITSDNINDGYLTPKLADKIGVYIS